MLARIVKTISFLTLVHVATQNSLEAASIQPAEKTDLLRLNIATTKFWLHEKAVEIPGLMMGPYVRTYDDLIVTIEGTKSYISKDGYDWDTYDIFHQPDKFEISDERALLRTSDGVIILAFANLKEKANWNWQADISDSPGAKVPTYSVRSLDGGKTWQDLQKLHNEWTGANRDIIETRNENIVFTSMRMKHNPGHHTVLTYMSRNQGKTWVPSNVIDMGGIGHHSGVTESTIEQLSNLNLWILMRTNWGSFWKLLRLTKGLPGEISNPPILMLVPLLGFSNVYQAANWCSFGIADFLKVKTTIPCAEGIINGLK